MHTALSVPRAGSDQQLYSCTSIYQPTRSHACARSCVNTHAHRNMRSSPDEVHCSRRLAKHDGRYVTDVQTQECSNIALWLPRPSRACARNLAILTAYIATARLPLSCSCRTCTPRSGHISGVATGLVFVPMCAHVCSTACQACCACTIKRVLLFVCGLPAVAIPSSDRAPPIDAVLHA